MTECEPPAGDGQNLPDRLPATLTYERGTYRTPPGGSRRVWRGFSSLSFYGSFFRTIWRSSARARRGTYGFDEWVESSVDSVRALERTGVVIDVAGLEHLQNLDGPAVIIGNHMSALETVALPAIIGSVRPVTFILKDSLFRTPIFHHIVEKIDAIGVSRTNPRADLKTVLQDGGERLKRGKSVVVFPQTTRTPYLDPSQFSSIGVKLAQRAGVPVVPLALMTSQAWAVGRWVKDVGAIDPSKPVKFSFGAPITVEGRGQDEHEQVMAFIGQELARWGAVDLDRPPASADGDATHPGSDQA